MLFAVDSGSDCFVEDSLALVDGVVSLSEARVLGVGDASDDAEGEAGELSGDSPGLDGELTLDSGLFSGDDTPGVDAPEDPDGSTLNWSPGLGFVFHPGGVL
ncbi:hypothetical protein [Mycolicibacterium insubricum]|uniref:hypothetical protein n=1 Tax=Mycolicibacterium insubricum TaxID=444597 RepID=UPI0021F29531|nr:hypothetical protein [Mycolicibacterium insubricum]MCV7082087.1 hypothetical protein [Mycolicibacterium insubricum]